MTFEARDWLDRLGDARSLTHGLITTAAIAGLELIDPRTLSAGQRLAYRCTIGVLTAWTTWAALRVDSADTVPVAARVGLAVGAGGFAVGASEAAEAIDGRLHDGLLRAGVRRPRLVFAAGAAVVSLATWWVGRGTPDQHVYEESSEQLTEEYVDVPEEVRALAATLLAATDSYGARELRAQLAEARAVVYEGLDPDGFWPGIGFHVPDSLALAVPGDANFAVIGRYRALDSRSFDVYLSIQRGRLVNLSIGEGGDWSLDDHVGWMEAGRGVHELAEWPEPDVLELLIETPAGLQPLG